MALEKLKSIFTEGFKKFENTDVTKMEDESFELDLPDYLNNAVISYVKAKLAEDVLNIEAKEYFMTEFRSLLEKYNNTRVSGLRIQAAGPHSIR